jgi:hypothetical protein
MTQSSAEPQGEWPWLAGLHSWWYMPHSPSIVALDLMKILSPFKKQPAHGAGFGLAHSEALVALRRVKKRSRPLSSPVSLFAIPVVFRGVTRMISISWFATGEKEHFPVQKSSHGFAFLVKGLGGYSLGSLQLPAACARGKKRQRVR